MELKEKECVIKIFTLQLKIIYMKLYQTKIKIFTKIPSKEKKKSMNCICKMLSVFAEPKRFKYPVNKVAISINFLRYSFRHLTIRYTGEFKF